VVCFGGTLMAKKKYQLALRSKFNPALLPAITNLVGLGCSEADIGLILGYAGKDARQWIKGLKKRNMDVRDACELGKRMANVALVSRAWQLAVEGYNYEETEETYKDGKLVETKIKKKHNKPNTALLQTLLRSRLPQDFSQKIQIDKRTMNVDVDVDAEVDRVFGNLINRKKVESTEVKETEGVGILS